MVEIEGDVIGEGEDYKKSRKVLIVLCIVVVIALFVLIYFAFREPPEVVKIQPEPELSICVKECMDLHCEVGSSDFNNLCDAVKERADDPDSPQPNRTVTDNDCIMVCQMVCETQCGERDKPEDEIKQD